MVWQGRYSDLFYAFARRWLDKESQLARRAHRRWARPAHVALRGVYRLGMEATSLFRRGGTASSVGGATGAMAIAGRTPDNLSNRTGSGTAYD
jgi:hypothetical protein